jgi:outer membrane lipoprotein-sorting protein
MFDVPLKSTKFDTETELLLRAAKAKLPLVEVPIKTIYAPDHASHFHGFRDTLRVIKLVFFSPLWALVLFAASCAHAPPPAPADLPASTAWKTMRAEHKVTIEAGGARRTIRGLIAVQRPDRFRLRALGPAGLTLFDVVDVAGQVRVVQAIKDPNGSALGKILPSMAGDLSAAYDLEPRPPERTVRQENGETIIRENGRTVRETPARIDIDNAAEHYKVHVDVVSVEKDVTLDPALWAQ